MISILSYSFLAHLLALPVKPTVVVKKLGYASPVDEFIDVEAYFGPGIQDEVPLSGFLYASEPIDGCENSIPLPEINSSALPFISLIRRGNCSFIHKVMAAKAGGYIGAVIFNNINDDIFPMSGNSDIPVSIASVMVGLTSGNRLKSKYCFSPNDYLVEIYADRHWDLQAYIIPVLILLGLFVVGVVVFGAFRIFEHRRRRQYRCLTTVQLNKLPQSTFIKGGTHSDTCAICLEDYTEGDEVRTLPCAHVYHSKCIDPWLLKGRRVCPICKRILFRGHRHRRPIFHRWRSSDDYDAENHQLLSDSISLDDGELSRGGGPNISYGAMNSTTYPLSSALAHVHAEAPYSPCDGSRSSVDHTSGRETSSISNDPDFSSTADTVGKSGKILISANHTHDVFDGDPVSGTRSAAQINSSTPGVNLENCPFTTRC